MKISARGTRLPASPIRSLVDVADRARGAGATVHPLNIGQPDLPTPPAFFEALRTYPDTTLAYGHSAGDARLRAALAVSYERLGYDVRPEHVTVTTGGSEAILFAMLLLCDPGDEIVCFEPLYTNYRGYATAAAVTLRPVRCPAESGYHLPPAEAILAAIGPRTRALLVCNPSNPTGTVLRPDEMRLLAEIALARDLYLVVDEVYRDFVYGEVPHTGVLALPELGDRAVMLDSLSKRFSVCGARVGCLVSRNPEINTAALHLAQARLCSPTLEQHGALALTALTPDYFAAALAEYRQRRDTVVEALAAIPGVTARTPEGAFYVMARLPVPDAGRFARWLLTDFRLDGETVMLAPGEGFYLSEGLGRDEVRIAYVIDSGRLRRAMACLGAGLSAWAER